ncbi:MAG: hypothetical protein SVO26_03505 [Chloroflexota bacterium]|nr:hypothetical protein [Chloroflexota bacterium]
MVLPLLRKQESRARKAPITLERGCSRLPLISRFLLTTGDENGDSSLSLRGAERRSNPWGDGVRLLRCARKDMVLPLLRKQESRARKAQITLERGCSRLPLISRFLLATEDENAASHSGLISPRGEPFGFAQERLVEPQMTLRQAQGEREKAHFHGDDTCRCLLQNSRD